MDEKIKTWTLRFPAKENPNMEKALFDWPIVLQYDVKAKYRLISRKFFGHEVFIPERSLNQPKATRVCIRSTNRSNRCIFVRLLFLSCSRVFISRPYEDRSNAMFTLYRTAFAPARKSYRCPENNLSERRRELTTNSTHIWRRRRDLNPGHIGRSHHCAIPCCQNKVVKGI